MGVDRNGAAARGVTFLTVVAGTNVLGVQFVNLTPFISIAAGLWIFAVLLWIILIYTFFSAVTITEPKPSIEVALNGSWLLMTVATESLSILGTLVARTLVLDLLRLCVETRRESSRTISFH
jgi:tellurite resistance protein TehA-like permease